VMHYSLEDGNSTRVLIHDGRPELTDTFLGLVLLAGNLLFGRLFSF